MGIVKEQVCNVFTVSLKKVRNEVDFLDADNIKVSYQKISTPWASKFSTR